VKCSIAEPPPQISCDNFNNQLNCFQIVTTANCITSSLFIFVSFIP
jgi:hypothetical protein